jgi:hypothetical protein
MAFLQQELRQMEPNEPSCASDENTRHETISLIGDKVYVSTA